MISLAAIAPPVGATASPDMVSTDCREVRTLYPSTIACLERDWEACLIFYAFPELHWKNIWTTNIIEIVFPQVTKANVGARLGRRNDVADFYLLVGGHDTVHQQFEQLGMCSNGTERSDRRDRVEHHCREWCGNEHFTARSAHRWERLPCNCEHACVITTVSSAMVRSPYARSYNRIPRSVATHTPSCDL